MVSCRFKFNDEDLTIYNTYIENQQLIFESENGVLDTFKITEKKIYYNSWTPIERDGRHNPSNAIIKYEKMNSNDFKIFNYNRKNYESPELIHIRKHSPNSPTTIAFKFQNFYTEFELNSDTLIWENIDYKGQTIKSIVLTDYNLHNKEDVKTIFLTENYDLIRYETGAGEIWNRKY